MAKLVWDNTGEKRYETGVDRGVLYVQKDGAYPAGVVWNGLTAVSESPSGAEPTPLYADNIKYLNLMSAEEFNATIEAYDSPEEFDECDGTKEIVPGMSVGQQKRSTFGFCYRTLIGNDTKGTSYGYKIHIVYGALAAPSEKGYQTVNDSPEAITFSWEISTTPVPVTGGDPTSTVIIDSTVVDAAKLKLLEDALYGTEGEEAHLPLPDEIAAILGEAA